MQRAERSKLLAQKSQFVLRNAIIFCEIYLFVLLLLLCQTAKAKGREGVSEAVAKLKQAVTEHPNSVETHFSLGRAYLVLSAMEEAEAAFLHALKLAPKSAEGYYWLGRTRYLQEKYETSRKTFQKAVELFPDWGGAYAEMGLSYFRLHQYKEAEAAYLKALSLMTDNSSPKIPPAPFNKGGAKRHHEIVEKILLSPVPLNKNEKQEWIAKVTPLSQADVYYYLSLVSFECGLWNETSSYCQKAIRIEPFAEAYFQLGLAAVQKRQLKEAEKAFREALRQKPLMTQAHYQLALLYFKQKKTTEATKEMETFKKLKKAADQFQEQHAALLRSVDKAPAFANLGWLYLNEQKYEEAAWEYQKALWHEPNFVEAYNGLSHAYALLGRFEEAIQTQQKALQLKPTMAEAYAGLGFIRMKQAETSQSEEGYKSAMRAYRKATELKPDFAEALLNLGNIALKLDGTEPAYYRDEARPLLQEAEKAFETLLSLFSQKKGSEPAKINLTQVHLALGQVYLRQKKFPPALRHYQEALKCDSNLVDAYYNMGFIAVKAGRLDVAVECYNEVLKRQPDMAEAHYLLGKIYAEQKKYEQAEKAYQRAIEIEYSAAYAYERLAHLYGAWGRHLDKGLKLAKKAVELQPNSVVYLNTLSWMYYLRKDYVQAEQAIKKALSLQPDNPVLKEGLKAIQEAGQTNEF